MPTANFVEVSTGVGVGTGVGLGVGVEVGVAASVGVGVGVGVGVCVGVGVGVGIGVGVGVGVAIGARDFEEDTMYHSTTHPVIPSENWTLQNIKPPACVGPAITMPRLPGVSDPIGVKAAFGFGLTFRLEPRFRST